MLQEYTKKMKNSAESYFYGIIVTIIILSYILYLAYWPWFRPLEWRKRMSTIRQKYRTDPLFVIQRIGLGLFDKHPNFDLWYERIVLLVGIVFAIVMLIFIIWNLK
jgi:hypothetical protein